VPIHILMHHHLPLPLGLLANTPIIPLEGQLANAAELGVACKTNMADSVGVPVLKPGHLRLLVASSPVCSPDGVGGLPASGLRGLEHLGCHPQQTPPAIQIPTSG